MRTTLTLDDDVARLLDDAVYRERRPMKQVVNDALRAVLRPPPGDRAPYRLRVHSSAVRAGVDPAGFNRLAADEESDAAIAALVGRTAGDVETGSAPTGVARSGTRATRGVSE